MSTPAIPADFFAGWQPAINGLRAQASQARQAVRRQAASIRGAATGVGRLSTEAGQAGRVLASLKTRAGAAAQSAGKLGQSAGRAGAGTKQAGNGARGVVASLRKLGGKTGGVLAIMSGLVGVTGIVATLMSTFGIAMTVGSVVMTAVNVAMRANPLGFALGILIPVAAWLIELAMNSETGRRLIEETFARVEVVFTELTKYLVPVLKTTGEIVGTYFRTYFAVVSGVVAVLRAAVGGFSGTGGSVGSATRSLRGIASGAFDAIMAPIRPVISFLTSGLPGAFSRVSGSLSGSLGGIGRMVTTGLQAVLAVVTGPFNGMIAFANWIIDGLEDLSFEILGKKFGVDLDKIPMLAEGGVVWPHSMGQAPRINPVSDLDHRRVTPFDPHAARQEPYRVKEFREEAGAGPRSTAEDLLFLVAAHA
ncbi:tape-measure protein [Streptomyces sp. ISL-43]|uniref:tape-measure protein n=1 Tax=Streptomyces sp. ISL-43 TaxID=2819183 RepID=UPI001BE50050|nr:tape-measure protein [Streptomyces sp. ISL-43]MBT2445910.1 tape-measure protein [Streptomyces sp. ISL-43]